MTFQAYLDSVKAKTGKTPDDFRTEAAAKGLTKHSEIMAWLKADYGLGHGHANAVTQVILSAGAPKVSQDDAIAAHFKGAKAAWRPTYDALVAEAGSFGDGFKLSTTKSYISLLKGDAKFAIVEPATADRFDIGIKLKGVEPSGRLEAAGAWNAMVTHRVRISAPEQVDAEVLGWLKEAFDAA